MFMLPEEIFKNNIAEPTKINSGYMRLLLNNYIKTVYEYHTKTRIARKKIEKMTYDYDIITRKTCRMESIYSATYEFNKKGKTELVFTLKWKK